VTPIRWLKLGAVLVLAGLLAFALRDVIQRTVIMPLVYLWWILGLLYHAIPQILLWALLVVFLLFMVVDSLLPQGRIFPRSWHEPKSVKGSVEGLADWMVKAPGGIYYKWLIANRLGKTAREILAQRAGRGVSRAFGPLKGREWTPPQEVAAYLDSGLNGSFAEFPRPRWPWLRREPTPLDLSLEEVIDFLESQIGNPK
jgi:hypothetical protein